MISNKIRVDFTISRATLSLVLLTFLCCILLIIRAVETQQVRGLFLLWNLFWRGHLYFLHLWLED